MPGDPLLDEQLTYYRKRAPEYDNWWHRTGIYELDDASMQQWNDEKAQLRALVDEWLAPYRDGRALELASGTGIWTEQIAPSFSELVAVDGSPETIAVARSKLNDDTRVRFECADLFEWTPDTRFDVVFFSFWISHVPPDRFEAFWDTVAGALAPGGLAVFIDNKAHDGVWPADDAWSRDVVQLRTDLSSGEHLRVVKVYYEPEELERRLVDDGWSAEVLATPRFFIAGTARLPS